LGDTAWLLFGQQADLANAIFAGAGTLITGAGAVFLLKMRKVNEMRTLLL
jgi:hypothetical protein